MSEFSPESAREWDAGKLAALHAAAFEDGWDEKVIRGWVDHLYGFSSVVTDRPDRLAAGFALAVAAGEDAELLTIAVAPEHRRTGVGRALLAYLDQVAESRKLERWLLEVACDNSAALSLYKSRGFSQIGRRRNYYRRSSGAVDALVLSAPVGVIGG